MPLGLSIKGIEKNLETIPGVININEFQKNCPPGDLSFDPMSPSNLKAQEEDGTYIKKGSVY